MISGILQGIQAYSKSLSYLTKPWVLKYLLLSGIISLTVFSILSYLIYSLGDDLGSIILNTISENPGEWISKIVTGITTGMLWLFLFFIFKYIVLIVTAPLMSGLSERLELEILGEVFDDNPNKLYTFYRGIRIALSNLTREIIFSLPLLLIGLIPGVLIISTALIFLIQAYYAGFGHFDFYFERRFKVKESRRFIKQNRWLSITIGSGFLMLFLIPIIGAFLAPTLATIASTIKGIDLVDYD